MRSIGVIFRIAPVFKLLKSFYGRICLLNDDADTLEDVAECPEVTDESDS